MKRTLLLTAVFLWSMVGCEDLNTGCDTSAASSVTVSIVDASGSLTAADTVTYDVDGAGEVDCDPLDSFGEEWVCGYEETGSFTIRAYVGADVFTGNVTVGMRPDGCHVESQFIDIAVQ